MKNPSQPPLTRARNGFSARTGGSNGELLDRPAYTAPYHPFRSDALKRRYLGAYDTHATRWPVASETRNVETSFGETFVRVQGLRDGPPLVLLHGDSENSLAWIPIIAALSARYRTYALDHIYDHGRSRYTRAPKTPADLTQWLDEFLSALGLGKVHLMGHSYGGWQAALYARDHPDMLASLILLSPPQTIIPAPVGLLARAIFQGLLPWRPIVKRYVYWYDRDCVKDEKTRWMIDEIIEEDLLAHRCLKPRTFIRPTVLSDDDWRSIETPTLYLVGENEASYSAEEALAKLRRIAPQVKTALAPGGDHHLTIVKPDWVVDHVLGFLDDQEMHSGQQ